MKELKREKIKGLHRRIAGNMLIIVLFTIQFMGMDVEANMWNFHFLHAGILHVIGNTIAISCIYDRFRWRLFPIAYLVGSLVWTLTPGAVGASAIIYFMWGSTLPVDFPRLNRKQRLIYTAGIIASLSFALFLPYVSFILHLLPFVIGIAIGGIAEEIRKFNRDTKGLCY